MTQDEVRDLIDKYIIKNSMGAITAVIMRPILEEILNQPNALIGNLEYLDTLEKTTIVDAINSIVNGQIVEINAKILELIEKDVEQDQRLDSVEQHDRDQDGRLDSIENHDASQDVRIDLIELKNEDQDEQITLINLKDNAQDIQIADLQNKDNEQDTRLTDIEGVNSNQDIEIQSLKNKDISQDAEIQNLKDKDILQDAEITDLDNRVDTLENKVATVYIPKGSVTDITALFALTNQGVGWVYNLEDTGMNYVWLGGNEGDQGNGWDSLGGWVDFSEYYTRLEVNAKLDAIDLQKVTDIGNTTTNDINIISEDTERLAILDSDDIILSDLTTGKNTALSNAGGNSVLEHTDNGITNGLSINKDKTVFTKVVQGVDAVDDLDYVTFQQVNSLPKGNLLKTEVSGGVAYYLEGNNNVPTTICLDLRVGETYTQMGNYSTSLGFENTASGGNSTISGGGSNTASGDGSTISGGGGNTASGGNSTISGGRSNTASGDNSTVSGGQDNEATAYYASVLAGFDNTASGGNSTISGGAGNTASGDNSTVSGGEYNTASGDGSTVSGGRYNTATNYSETVVGMYSTGTVTPESSRVAGSPIFRVAIGTSNTNRKDGFIVTNEGDLKLPESGKGIELKSPNGTAYKLTVSDDGELVITSV